MALEEGADAINFSLKDKDGKIHKLSDIKSKFIVLYFYPKDDTPGCTIEANLFNGNIGKFKDADAEIIGISGGNEKTKKNFCSKYSLNITLLSDSGFEISKKYGVFKEKNFFGKRIDAIGRITFIIKNGKIIKVFRKVYPDRHTQEVLDFLKSLTKK